MCENEEICERCEDITATTEEQMKKQGKLLALRPVISVKASTGQLNQRCKAAGFNQKKSLFISSGYPIK